MTRVSQPRPGEPIRVVLSKHGPPRYRGVLTTGIHPDGRRRQTTTTHDTLTDARTWVSETRLAVRRGTFTAPDRRTVDDLLTAWEDSRRDIRPITLNTYKSVLRPVRARLGAMRVQDVHRSDVDGFVGWLIAEGGKSGKGVSHRTVSLTIGTMKQAWRYAVDEGMIPASPVEGVKPPRRRAEDERTVIVWTAEQLAAFTHHADRHEWAALWRLTAAGLRRSEVCGLTWDAVDLDAGTVAVTQGRVVYSGTIATDDPKSRASRRVMPLEQTLPGSVGVLRGLRAQQAAQRLAAGSAWEDSGFVLADALGRPVHPEAYSAAFRALCQTAGVPVVRLHDVRHSVNKRLEEAGLSAEFRAQFLGHSKIVNLEHYTVSTDAGMQAAAEAYAATFAQARQGAS